MKKRGAGLLLATSSLALSTMAQAGVTTTYTYDALGRLVAVSTTGDVNNGLGTSVSYDPAGNRTSYWTGTGAAPPPPLPVPLPVPPPTPDPPPVPPPATITPLNPTFNVSQASSTMILLTTLANPNGKPAVIQSFTPPAGGGSATIAADGQSVTYVAPSLTRPPNCEVFYTNTYSVPYSIRDTSTSAVVTGTATINVKSQNGILTGCP